MWQISYPPVNGASLGHFFVPIILYQSQTWSFIDINAGFGEKTVFFKNTITIQLYN